MLTQRATRTLVTIQSLLITLQYIGAAGILADFVTPRYGALFVVVIAAAQQGVNFYISKSVGETVTHVAAVVDRAQAATAKAEDATVQAKVAAQVVKEIQNG